ncbi:MAG: hypothetical protein OXS30_10930 [Chloroflexota bacterium]|nr:hypothetical protein [Chloroflexota bacterium]
MSEMHELDGPDGLEGLDLLRVQAEAEKSYRQAVDTLIMIMIAYCDQPDPQSLVGELTRDFPGSTEVFWLGVLEMTADALSEDGLVPQRWEDG